MNKEYIVQLLKQKKNLLKERFNIIQLGLFGSYSTGNHHPDSDIDIVFEVAPGKYLGLKEMDELEKFIKNLISVNKVDLVNKKYMNPIIEKNMQKSVIYV